MLSYCRLLGADCLQDNVQMKLLEDANHIAIKGPVHNRKAYVNEQSFRDLCLECQFSCHILIVPCDSPNVKSQINFLLIEKS
jgi:hypothetical protein